MSASMALPLLLPNCESLVSGCVPVNTAVCGSVDSAWVHYDIRAFPCESLNSGWVPDDAAVCSTSLTVCLYDQLNTIYDVYSYAYTIAIGSYIAMDAIYSTFTRSL